MFDRIESLTVIDKAGVYIFLLLNRSLNKSLQNKYGIPCSFIWHKPILFRGYFLQRSSSYSVDYNSKYQLCDMTHKTYRTMFVTFGRSIHFWQCNKYRCIQFDSFVRSAIPMSPAATSISVTISSGPGDFLIGIPFKAYSTS